MQTNLAPSYKGTREGEEAEAILRKCVHCGFCTATCPTYQLLGDELDGPRGRISLASAIAGLNSGEVRPSRSSQRSARSRAGRRTLASTIPRPSAPSAGCCARDSPRRCSRPR